MKDNNIIVYIIINIVTCLYLFDLQYVFFTQFSYFMPLRLGIVIILLYITNRSIFCTYIYVIIMLYIININIYI